MNKYEHYTQPNKNKTPKIIIGIVIIIAIIVGGFLLFGKIFLTGVMILKLRMLIRVIMLKLKIITVTVARTAIVTHLLKAVSILNEVIIMKTQNKLKLSQNHILKNILLMKNI